MYVLYLIIKYVCSYFVTNSFSFACYNVRSYFVIKCAVNLD